MGDRTLRVGLGFVSLAMFLACSPKPADGPDSSPSAAVTTSAPAVTAAPAVSASATAAAPATAAPVTTGTYVTTVVIHQADLFGEIQGRVGSTVHVLSLVATKAPPAAGVKGILLRGSDVAGDGEWVHIADVTVKKEADGGGNLQLTITDEKKDALIGGKKLNHFVKGVRVKFRWEY